MVIVKHETHHLHDFMVKLVIFNVNRVNFDQEQCTVTLIQRKLRSKNRLGAETIVHCCSRDAPAWRSRAAPAPGVNALIC